MKGYVLMNKFNLLTCTKEKNKKPETRNSENNICFPFGMIHKIRFSLIECDDSQIICYLFPSLSWLKDDERENSEKQDSKAKERKILEIIIINLILRR